MITDMGIDIVIAHRDKGKLAEIGMRCKIFKSVQLRLTITWMSVWIRGTTDVQQCPEVDMLRIRPLCDSESGTFCHSVCIVPVRAGHELSTYPRCPFLCSIEQHLVLNCSADGGHTVGDIVLHPRVHINFELSGLL
jgi:hypothetical protein